MMCLCYSLLCYKHRVDESVASKAVRRASTHKERAHAMMSSSIGWSQPQPPMTPITTASRTTSQTFSYSDDDGDVYSSVDHVSGSGYQSSVQRITVVPPPVPIYDDAPMSARVRMQVCVRGCRLHAFAFIFVYFRAQSMCSPRSLCRGRCNRRGINCPQHTLLVPMIAAKPRLTLLKRTHHG